MSVEKKIEHAAQDVKGKVKEGVGAATGNDGLKHEGQRDQTAAEVKHKADQVKDSATHAAQDVKGKVKEGLGAATDDEGLSNEGRGDQAAAEVKEHFNK